MSLRFRSPVLGVPTEHLRRMFPGAFTPAPVNRPAPRPPTKRPVRRAAPPAPASREAPEGVANAVSLVGEITEASAVKTIAQIQAVKGDLTIMVDSNGGDVAGAMDIAAALQRHTGKTSAIVLRAESAAVIPMSACGTAVIATDGHVLLHCTALHAPGGVTLHNMAEATDALKQTQRQIADVLAARSKSTPTTFWTHLMNQNNGAGTRLEPQDCVNYGICDEISVYPKRWLRDGRR